MPSALLRARPWSVILASALPLYALSACELFLGDVTDPGGDAGKVTGPIGAAGHGGVTSSMGGEAATGADSSAPGGGTAGTGSGGRGTAGAGGLGAGGVRAGGAPGTGGAGAGGVVTSGGAPGTGGVTAGGAPGTGGAATGGVAGTGGAPGSGGAGGCCDCDGDKVKAIGPCGGTDCDDTDANVFPGQTLYFDTPSKNRGFDYNCDNSLERDPGFTAFVNCNVILGLCDATKEGFFGTAPPACGVPGSWGMCVKGTLSCSNGPTGSRTPPCR